MAMIIMSGVAAGAVAGAVAHAMELDPSSSIILGALIAFGFFVIGLFLSHRAAAEIRNGLKENSTKLDTIESLLREILKELRRMNDGSGSAGGTGNPREGERPSGWPPSETSSRYTGPHRGATDA